MLEEVIEVLLFTAFAIVGLGILLLLLIKWARGSFRFPDSAVRSLRNLLLAVTFLGGGSLFVWLLEGIEYAGIISFGLSALVVIIVGFCAHRFLPLADSAASETKEV